MPKERKQKERRLLEKVREDHNGGFARALASNDWATRERGLQALTLWLSGHRNVQEKDLLRLWKALFYCFWHSDKVPVQTALAERLSEIMGAVPPAVGRLYFRVFVRTMRREWFGIDRHRMDKFMMLVRKLYAAHLRFLAATGWDDAAVTEFAEFWRAEVLLPSDTLAAAGFSYHVADLVLPELGRVAAEAGAPPPAAVDALLEPFCAAAAATQDAVMVRRLAEGLWSGIAAELRAPSDGDALRNLDAAALAERLFDLGAKQETRAANRDALYAASKEIEAAEAQREKPGAKKVKKQKTAVAVDAQQEEDKPAKKAGSKKRKAAEEAEAPARAPAAAETPVAEKPKGKKAKAAKAAAAEEAAAAATPAATAAAATPNGVDSSSKKKKKKKDKAEGVEEAGPSGAAAAVTPGSQHRSKSVRFSLKRNLVNVIGQPPLPEDVRTPPTARPKGSALKVRGAAVRQPSLLGRKPAAAAAPASAPPKVGGSRLGKGRSPVGTRSVTKAKGNAPRTLPSPASVPRPKAAQFF